MHGRKALLPHPVLDDDRHEIPTPRACPRPHMRRRGAEEVGDDEDERARGNVAPQLEQIVDGQLQTVRGRVELVADTVEYPPRRLPVRSDPVRRTATEVEVA